LSFAVVRFIALVGNKGKRIRSDSGKNLSKSLSAGATERIRASHPLPEDWYSLGRAVYRAFANSLLSLLMLATLVWGGCVSCDEYFMWPGAKSCCSPNGHCKTKAPSSPQKPNRECRQIAFDHQKTVDHPIELPMIAIVKIDLLLRAIESVEHWPGVNPVEPSPPDLQVLHSAFLI
jgi:hypothetical protein